MLLSVLAVWCGPAAAQTSNGAVSALFTVADVPADATAQSAAAAREAALAEGQREAFQRLLRRLTPQNVWPSLPDPSVEDVQTYIRDFEVAKEKTSTVRYLANLTVRFDPEAVTALLTSAKLPYVETTAPPAVVAPLLRSPDGLTLWDDPNPWAYAWRERLRSNPLIPLVMPLGDLGDLAALTPEQAESADRERLAALAARYSVPDALLVAATLVPGAVERVDIVAIRVGETEDGTFVASVSAEPGETTESLYGRAVDQVVQQSAEQWKRSHLIQPGPANSVAVTVPVGRLADLMEVRRQLGRVPLIRRADLVAVSHPEARMVLHFSGEIEALAAALAEQGLDLSLASTGATLTGGSEWVLRRGAPGNSVPPALTPPPAPGTQPGTQGALTVTSGHA